MDIRRAIPPLATSQLLTELSPKAAGNREHRRRWYLCRILARRALIASVLGALLLGCAPPRNLQATNLIHLSEMALKNCFDEFRTAYAAKNDDYKAYPQFPAAPNGQEERQASAERSGDRMLRRVVTEASNRFGVPERWIRATIVVESAGVPVATSPMGAMGLMQVMPGTYAELRDRFGLGDDPYAIRDNILAGSAYLRQMYDRYGSPGFIAAYNAGPQRYDEYLRNGRALPDETRRYLLVVGNTLGQDFSGSVFGELPIGDGIRLGHAIVISQSGDLFGRSRQPPTTSDRLALHSLLSRAIGLPN